MAGCGVEPPTTIQLRGFSCGVLRGGLVLGQGRKEMG